MPPLLPTLADQAPAGDEWLHELKHDGYRMLCRIEKGEARMLSRSGKDWTDTFANVARAAARLPVESAWIDGEVVVNDSQGRSSFQSLQNALSHENSGKYVYLVFDSLR